MSEPLTIRNVRKLGRPCYVAGIVNLTHPRLTSPTLQSSSSAGTTHWLIGECYVPVPCVERGTSTVFGIHDDGH